MNPAFAFFAVHHLPAALGVLAVLVSVTLTYTGTNLGAVDQLAGTLGPYADQEFAGIEPHSATGRQASSASHTAR